MTTAAERVARIAAAVQKRIDSQKATSQRSKVAKAFEDQEPAKAEPDANRRLRRVQAVTASDKDVAKQLVAGKPPENLLGGDELFAAERLLGNTVDFLPVSFLTIGMIAASSVARVVRRTGQPVGSGCLISGRLFLTNNHVFGSDDEAGGMLLEFDYETDLRGQPRATTRFELDPAAFFFTNERDDLDFTVVAVGKRFSGAKKLTDFGFCPVSDRDDKHMLGEFVNVIQHPEGRLKQLVLRENKLVTRLDTVVHYAADTQPGSSGSPVFNDEWALVALHHWSGPHREKKGGDGQLLPTMVNEGIRVSAIVKHLREKRESLADAGKKALLDEALSAADVPRSEQPRAEIEGRPPEPVPAEPARIHGARAGAARVNADGSVTLSLEVNVRLAGVAPAARRAAGTAESVGTGFSAASLSATAFDWRTALSTALACQLVYSDGASVEETALDEWGLQTCKFLSEGDTQCFVASTADTALVCFRGTEAVGDWLANLDTFYTTPGDYGKVHSGFYHALANVSYRVGQVLATLSKPRVVLTGHSLGGAMATILAAEARNQLPIEWVYTFGQPRTGRGDAYVSAVNDHYGKRFVRFVNDDDVVPRVPPWPFAHVGRLVHFGRRGSVGGDPESLRAEAAAAPEAPEASADDPPALSEAEFRALKARMRVAEAVPGAAAAEGLFPSISDHFMSAYLPKIAAQVGD